VANALAFYDMVTITAVKSFIVQASGVNLIKLLGVNLPTLLSNVGHSINVNNIATVSLQKSLSKFMTKKF
jgi:hypothetical protein